MHCSRSALHLFVCLFCPIVVDLHTVQAGAPPPQLPLKPTSSPLLEAHCSVCVSVSIGYLLHKLQTAVASCKCWPEAGDVAGSARANVLLFQKREMKLLLFFPLTSESPPCLAPPGSHPGPWTAPSEPSHRCLTPPAPPATGTPTRRGCPTSGPNTAPTTRTEERE